MPPRPEAKSESLGVCGVQVNDRGSLNVFLGSVALTKLNGRIKRKDIEYNRLYIYTVFIQ